MQGEERRQAILSILRNSGGPASCEADGGAGEQRCGERSEEGRRRGTGFQELEAFP